MARPLNSVHKGRYQSRGWCCLRLTGQVLDPVLRDQFQRLSHAPGLGDLVKFGGRRRPTRQGVAELTEEPIEPL